MIDRVYEVVEGFYFIGNRQETVFGTYTTKERAEAKLEKVKQFDHIDHDRLFIREIVLDVDMIE